MTQRLAIDALNRQYLWLDANFNHVYEFLTAERDRTALRRAYASSRDNVREARGRVFVENDPAIHALLDDLGEMEARLETAREYGPPEAVLTLVTTSVNLACRLVTTGIIC